MSELAISLYGWSLYLNEDDEETERREVEEEEEEWKGLARDTIN